MSGNIVSSTSSYLDRKTPGVYITEIDAFGTGIVGVATAVPIFIGYTEFAADPVTGKPLYNKAVPVSSMMEYSQSFGGAAPAGFAVTLAGNPSPSSGSASGSSSSGTADAIVPDFKADFNDGTSVKSTGFLLNSTAIPGENSSFNLYWALMAFFDNGGSDCFVVSVDSYYGPPKSYPTTAPAAGSTVFLNTISPDELMGGIDAAGLIRGPTMTVVPEACLLATSDGATITPQSGYGDIVQHMLSQASVLQDRVAIMDPPGVTFADTKQLLASAQTGLSEQIAPAIASASYGAVYAPAINASVISPDSILYTNIAGTDGSEENQTINNILTTQAAQLYEYADPETKSGGQLASVQAAIATAFPAVASTPTPTPAPTPAPAPTPTPTPAASSPYSLDASGYPAQAATQSLADWQLGLDNFLLTTLPVFKQIETLIAASMNVLPASGFAAGVWAASDARNGVWNAPANVALSAAVSPYYAMTDAEQAGYNVPVNGQAINIVRAQPSRGNVVWGARTFDGNSNDYRYIQVRRTLIYIEQSIQQALAPYVFAPNDSLTWSTVSAAISSFLTDLWQRGGLMGDKPSNAFTVSVGLGTTMTAQNVLDGYMIVAVTLQLIHPAEFIELTFTQTMGS